MKQCIKCGKPIGSNSRFCPHCGASIGAVTLNNYDDYDLPSVSPKSRLAAALLALCFGIHRFYVGKIWTGILLILLELCYGVGCVWSLIDFFTILAGEFKDKDGLPVKNWF